MNRVRGFARDEGGVSAVELGILGPAFLALLLGVIQGGLLIYTQASLHYAVQKSVRCTALMNNCPSPDRYYFGLGAPAFATTPQTCGQALTGTVTYSLNVVLYQRNIPLSATSCFPDIKSASS